MENLNSQLVEATENYLKSDKLKEVIEAQAEKMVNEVVSEAFRWSGNVRKQVEEFAKNELSINTKELGIQGQNKFITEVVGKKLKQYIREDTEKLITKQLDDILKPIEKVVSIDTLKKKLFEAADTNDFGCGDMDYVLENVDEDEIYTFIVEEPGGMHEWVTLYFDKEPNKETYECEFELTVHKTNTSFKIKQREIKATDKVMNPYIWDIEDFVYCMFLNDSTINYEEAKAY
ncbi:hypothetical protein [Poseidonibacter lekithochrous]|uniref:hypothetical protein n=1 Tax=Poseidonibacter lekithochrous TaxID=1904463 RepID=UPI000D360307|nr:hypothetical protein [Poseidonibacter lekithochrous]